jgi:hypothetical protein
MVMQFKVVRAVTTVAVAGLFAVACDQPVAPVASSPVASSPSNARGALQFRFNSEPQIRQVKVAGQPRPYPGTDVIGEGSVCKDASSPAGLYTFNVSVDLVLPGDIVASSVTLSPGECAIVYNRFVRPSSGPSEVSYVFVTESIPGGALYSLDHVEAHDDVYGMTSEAGPTSIFLVNGYHGGYSNFFNVGAAGVDLGANSLNGILAGTTVTCISGGAVGGDISVSTGTAITGFGPCTLSGVQHSNDAVAQQGQLDLTAAYNSLAGLPCPPANIISADLGGTTKAAGVYCSGSSIGVTGNVTLDGGGDANAVFVFQAGSTLTTAGNVVLINGAQARNVYWQVGSSATIGTASQWKGNILAQASITMVTNAKLRGRALARDGAVTLGTGNTITLP